ncbi:MAG TPA: PfkB family carbohydrate kinase [Pyrinomonadaceae bacterium]|jgi:sugar/nucleoside kinase (ribokinase family)
MNRSSLHSHASFRRLVGVGGIGSGILFALEGDHDLGRNESRPARLLDIRDYCKLHIITHYLGALVGAGQSENSFRVLPIGKVGGDSAGRRLLKEMTAAGLDTRYVDEVEGQPTLFSVCYQYPDRTGGNITTSESAASLLTPADIDRVIPLLEAGDGRSIALAVPEVPLEVRAHLLKLATIHQCFRVASFTSAEMSEAQASNLFSLVDLLALNEGEAGCLAGQPFDAAEPQSFLDQCADALTASQPHIRIIVSAGKEGAFAFQDGRWAHSPALPVEVASTAGAGDALLAGVLAALIAGAPLVSHAPSARDDSRRVVASALDFGVLLASYSATSPHTIHPRADLDAVLDFAAGRGVTFAGGLDQIFIRGDEKEGAINV